jgi:hypothetical protein
VAAARGIEATVSDREPPWWSRGFALDLRSLALFRVAIAGCLLADLLLRLPEIDDFYTDTGVLPRAALFRLKDPIFCLHCLSGQWWVELVLFLIAIGCALTFMVGYRTRLATVVSWLLFISMHARSPLSWHGGDSIMGMMLFWGMFLPLNGRLALDRHEPPLPVRHLSPAGVALVLQVCIIYWGAFMEKMDPIWLTERSAVYYALHLSNFALPLGGLLLQHIVLLRALTTGTLLIELVGPLLAIVPIHSTLFRLLTVASFAIFHVSLALTMRLGTFPFICVAMWLALLPSAVWQGVSWRPGWMARLRRRPARAPGRLSAALATAAILVVAVSIAYPATRPADAARQGWLGLVGLEQRWWMFAPHPGIIDGWFVMEGMRGDRRVDVWNGGPANDLRPASFASAYRNTRWLSYLMKIQAGGPFGAPFADYLCRAWNAHHEPVDSVAIFFMLMPTPPIGGPEPRPEKQLVWRQACGTPRAWEPGQPRQTEGSSIGAEWSAGAQPGLRAIGIKAGPV